MSDAIRIFTASAILGLPFLFCPSSPAQEALVTLRSTVTGNQEQPKVMYILPWQAPGSAKFGFSPGSDIADELFAPIDREEFVRGMKYQAMIESSSSPEAGGD